MIWGYLLIRLEMTEWGREGGWEWKAMPQSFNDISWAFSLVLLTPIFLLPSFYFKTTHSRAEQYNSLI
jgi:hypothetical protein